MIEPPQDVDSMSNKEQRDLEVRLRVLLPETYEVFDDAVEPRSMGSAGLKFGGDGKVLWNEMWGSFCDLAMAGGPPHRGRLLEPSKPGLEEIQAPAYEAAAAEICRGISLVTGLCAEQAPIPGWVRLYCTSAAMTGWLMRAIMMENVSAIGSGLALHLPTGADFRLEKEVKNVITAVAKTCHYWQEHMSEGKHEEIAALLARMESEVPMTHPTLIGKASSGELAALADRAAERVHTATGLERASAGYKDWLGFECRDHHAAIWMMRALAVHNVLSRREGTVVFLPVNDASDSGTEQSARAVIEAHRLARGYQLFL